MYILWIYLLLSVILFSFIEKGLNNNLVNSKWSENPASMASNVWLPYCYPHYDYHLKINKSVMDGQTVL